MKLDAARCDPSPKLVSFDFHSKTSGSRYEEGLGELREILKDDIRAQGVSSESKRIKKFEEKYIPAPPMHCCPCSLPQER